jgi:hypothetical protein
MQDYKWIFQYTEMIADLRYIAVIARLYKASSHEIGTKKVGEN